MKLQPNHVRWDVMIYWCPGCLQHVAELEQRWENEKQEIVEGKLTNNEVFFIDYHLQEVS